eukprot:TRINITY_DN66749_c2_g3_i4.p1 TRINITY_DN66749_c2_g3~~TRINITY_DN66749_c2_g3_i4.p1  ORF type:complete len:123 (-),score=9.87 TRINITY_DN66749_c2_g3_i4:595-963(-)
MLRRCGQHLRKFTKTKLERERFPHISFEILGAVPGLHDSEGKFIPREHWHWAAHCIEPHLEDLSDIEFWEVAPTGAACTADEYCCVFQESPTQQQVMDALNSAAKSSEITHANFEFYPSVED